MTISLRSLARLAAIGLLPAASACVASGPPAGPSPAVLAEDEPVAFLLERRDSLRLSDQVALDLARLNARLFRRNQPLRFTVDTILDRSGHRGRPGMMPSAETQLPEEVRARITPLLDSIRANADAVRDTAYAMLTDSQRTRADAMLERARLQAARRGGREAPGTGRPETARP